jgi:hypothetical protein
MPGTCRHDRTFPRGVMCSLDVSPAKSVARHGFRAPPSAARITDHCQAICELDPSVRSHGLRGIPGIAVHPPERVVRPQSSHPLQGIAATLVACLRGGSTGLERTRGLPGFRPLQHIRIGAVTHVARVCRTRLRSASRVSNPPDGFPRPDPSRLVSSRKRSWGCALQSIVPSEEPSRLSAPAALLTLTSPARLAAPSRRRHTQNHGSRAQVRPAVPREPEKAVFRALLPSEIRSRPAVV